MSSINSIDGNRSNVVNNNISDIVSVRKKRSLNKNNVSSSSSTENKLVEENLSSIKDSVVINEQNSTVKSTSQEKLYTGLNSDVESKDHIEKINQPPAEKSSSFSFSSLIPSFLRFNTSKSSDDLSGSVFYNTFGEMPNFGTIFDSYFVVRNKSSDHFSFSNIINPSKIISSITYVSNKIVSSVKKIIIPIIHFIKTCQRKLCDILGVKHDPVIDKNSNGKASTKDKTTGSDDNHSENDLDNINKTNSNSKSDVTVKEIDNKSLITPSDTTSYVGRISPLLDSQKTLDWKVFSDESSINETNDISKQLDNEFADVKKGQELSHNFTDAFPSTEYALNNVFLKNITFNQFMLDFQNKIPEKSEQQKFSTFSSKDLFKVPTEYILKHYPDVSSYSNANPPIYRYEFSNLDNEKLKITATKIVFGPSINNESNPEKHMYGIRTHVTVSKDNTCDDISYETFIK